MKDKIEFMVHGNTYYIPNSWDQLNSYYLTFQSYTLLKIKKYRML